MAFSQNSIVAAGCDKRIIAYGREGRSFQHFDYSREEDEHEFTCAVSSPSGQSIVIGSFDKYEMYIVLDMYNCMMLNHTRLYNGYKYIDEIIS